MDPEHEEDPDLTQSVIAPQREAMLRSMAGGRGSVRGNGRERGPHPLPLFLAEVTAACRDDPARLRQVLAGVRRYQEAPVAAARTERPVVAAAGGVVLRDHGGAGVPVVVVPSLINPPTVLDLAEGNSMLAGLAARGVRPLLVDWGATEPQGLAALVTERLVPLVEGLGEPVAMAGYCLGGTLAVAAAAVLGDRVTRLGLLATPWHFDGYGAARAGLADWWRQVEPLAAALGAVPIDLLQPAFWSLDRAGLVAKYARLAAVPAAEVAAFAALEDWSNTGAPLSLAAAAEMAALFADDAPGRGEWRIGGRRVAAGDVRGPVLDVIAARDRIVPAAAALSRGGVGVPLVLHAGHVGMVVGGRASEQLWDPLAGWLQG